MVFQAYVYGDEVTVARGLPSRRNLTDDMLPNWAVAVAVAASETMPERVAFDAGEVMET